MDQHLSEFVIAIESQPRRWSLLEAKRWLRERFNETPCWVTSFVIHAVAVILLSSSTFSPLPTIVDLVLEVALIEPVEFDDSPFEISSDFFGRGSLRRGVRLRRASLVG